MQRRGRSFSQENEELITCDIQSTAPVTSGQNKYVIKSKVNLIPTHITLCSNGQGRQKLEREKSCQWR